MAETTETPTAESPTGENTATTEQPGSQSPGTGGPGTNNEIPPFYMNPLIWLMAGVWLWLLYSWHKQKKQREERQQELKSINKGDKVVTIGRLHGVVVKSDEKTVTIKPSPKADVELTFDRVAVHKAGAFDKTDQDGESS